VFGHKHEEGSSSDKTPLRSKKKKYSGNALNRRPTRGAT